MVKYREWSSLTSDKGGTFFIEGVYSCGTRPNEKCGLTQYHAKLSHSLALAKPGKNAYTKREPRFLLQTETGAGTARFAPPVHGYQLRTMFYDPAHPYWAGSTLT